ncbi:hypothetical protein ACIPRD_13275 [Streptomyces sp. NPDC090108]|uniref:hypothetical protein n=1 Tax=Streptomyces sp. NPDC090108 TaxID=3365947 RepID=UPI00380F04EC
MRPLRRLDPDDGDLAEYARRYSRRLACLRQSSGSTALRAELDALAGWRELHDPSAPSLLRRVAALLDGPEPGHR